MKVLLRSRVRLGVALVALALLGVACKDSVVVIEGGGDDAVDMSGGPTFDSPDMRRPTIPDPDPNNNTTPEPMPLVDMGMTSPPDMRRDDPTPLPDMRVELPDPEPDMRVELPEPDMKPEPMRPPGPPPSDSVEQVKNNGCTTGVVAGLSQQLIDEMNCIQPGTLSRIDQYPQLDLYAVVFPYLQTPAALALGSTANNQPDMMRISSALRTLPQQYLLYRWYQEGKCGIGLAASPGRSNHNGALALDTPDYSGWKARLQSNSFSWLGSRDVVHFDYQGGADIRELSVLAFQRLWNMNNPNDQITEDGEYGPQTEGRLKQAPSNGFSVVPWCPNAMSQRVEGLAPPIVRLERVDDASLEIAVIAPSVVRWVEYAMGDEVFATSARGESGPNFDEVLELGEPSVMYDTVMLDVRAMDSEGRILSTTQARIPGQMDAHQLWVIPDGSGLYKVRAQEPPAEAEWMQLVIGGTEELVARDPSVEQRAFDATVSLRRWADGEPIELDVRFIDSSGAVIDSTSVELTVSL